VLSPSLVTAPRTATLGGIVYTITDGIRKHTDNTVVAFIPESKGIVIYIFPKDGSGTGTVLNINHDIVPQVIGKTLAGVSHDKRDKAG
jgi:hypothetical protein